MQDEQQEEEEEEQQQEDGEAPDLLMQASPTRVVSPYEELFDFIRPQNGARSNAPAPTAASAFTSASAPPDGRDGCKQSARKEKEKIRVPEYLQLSLEEAFFLTYAVGVLEIKNPATDEVMDISTCWKTFRHEQANFSSNYAVYHHLRACGWVPKAGLKFGVEFLAYRQGSVTTLSSPLSPSPPLPLSPTPGFANSRTLNGWRASIVPPPPS